MPAATSKKAIKARAREVQRRLSEEYPGTAKELCALEHRNPFELLAATILSAQCTDVRVNIVTPALFEAYPGPAEMAAADPEAVEELIRTTGFFRSKAKNLIGMARRIRDDFAGAVPSGMEDLVTLPGVGRKTANVLRSVEYGLPGLPVDTHVARLSKRLGLTTEENPTRIEADLCDVLPEETWGAFSIQVILHGRQVCAARKPLCAACLLADICPSATKVSSSRG